MALTLTANITNSVTDFWVTGTVTQKPGFAFRVGDELMQLIGFGPKLPVGRLNRIPAGVDENHWRVQRATGGSLAASHSLGAAILGASDAWTSGDDEGQPDPFEELLESLPIATSDVTGLDTALATIPADASELTVSPAVAGESDVQGALEALAPTAISLTDTDATTAQVSDVLDTRGGKAIALLVELTDYPLPAVDSVLAFVLTRYVNRAWTVVPVVFVSGSPTLDREVGGNGAGTAVVIPTIFSAQSVALMAESVIGVDLGPTGQAALTTDFADANGNVTFTALFPGEIANRCSVQFVDPGQPDQPLRVSSPDGWKLVISLATDSEGAITTTASHVQLAVSGAGSAWTMPFVGAAPSGSGAGIVEATDELPLTGGTDEPSGPITYSVEASV